MTSTRPSLLFDRWPRFAARHPWRVLAGAAIVVAGLITANVAAGGSFVDEFSIPGTESQQAFDVLLERFPQQSGDVATAVVHSNTDINSPARQEQVQELITGFGELPGVASVASPYDVPGSISQDGTIARFDVRYAEPAFQVEVKHIEELFDFRAEVSTDDLTVELGGPVAVVGEIEPPGESELIGFAAAIVILLVAFGSVVAMGLPILTALMGLIPGFMIIGVASAFVNMASFTPQFASMIGIGVGIDYALLITTRFREGTAAGLSLEDAIARAMTTAGRAVLFAGTVVVIALMGLWASGIPFLGWVATAAATLVAALVIVAVLVLPAILRLVGRHINRLSISFIAGSRTSAEAGAGARWSRMLRRSPLLFLILSLALLLTLASPILSMRLGSADAGSNPESSTTRRAYDLLSEGFGPGFNGPILVALEIDDPNAKSLVEALPGQIDQIEGVAFSSPPLFNEAEDAAIISIIPETSPQDEKTGELVDRLRTFLPQETAGSGARAFVGGQTAAFIDIAQKLSDGMPVFFVAVIGVSVLLLAIVKGGEIMYHLGGRALRCGA